MRIRNTLFLAVLLAATLPALQGCFPLVATGVAVGVLTVTDRRTVGMQTEDETIEWKISRQIGDKYGDKVHVNPISYNRKVLLAGQVPNEQIKAEIAELAGRVDNVVGVYNEFQIGAPSSLAARSTDTYITSKVKARFVDAGKFAPNHVKVVTEAKVVYLLGIVNQREADAAIQTARTTADVQKVVNILTVVAEAETKRLDGAVGQKPVAAPPGQGG